MAKIILQDFSSGYALVSVLNANNALIEAAIENTLSRDGTVPNQMAVDLDLNSNQINNLADGVLAQDAATFAQVNTLIAAASDPLTSATAALVSIIDAGAVYVGTDVEAALQELPAIISTAIAAEAPAEVTATTAVEGIVELATAAEIDAGTADKIADGAALQASDNFGVETGSFTITWSGFTTVVTSNCEYRRAGNLVTLLIEGSPPLGTSNTTVLDAPAATLPASIIPIRTQRFYQVIRDNTTNERLGSINVNNGGGLDVLADAFDSTVNFTASGQKGLPFVIVPYTYMLD